MRQDLLSIILKRCFKIDKNKTYDYQKTAVTRTQGNSTPLLYVQRMCQWEDTLLCSVPNCMSIQKNNGIKVSPPWKMTAGTDAG